MPPGPPPRDLGERIAALLGRRVVTWTPVLRGYTVAVRAVAALEDGSSVFVKAAADADTARWLHAEQRVYAAVRARFLPRVHAADEDPDVPLLVLEDLSNAVWPPPWTPLRVERVLAALAAVRATAAPPGLFDLEQARSLVGGWARLAGDPSPFLALGVCSDGWLDAALPALRDAEAALVLAGDELVHFDVRSDNLCFDGGRTLLVDWNWAARGAGRFDVAAWLPSLAAEGGPPPEATLPDAPAEAAALAGYFAAQAGLPPPSGGPSVRRAQLAQLRTALPWAARELGLPPPDGTDVRRP